MQLQEFDFTGATGLRLSGRLDLPEGAPKAYALFAHCFTCTKKSLAAARISRALASKGIGVLRFDFTGLGDSEGDFAETDFTGNVQDVVAAATAMASKDIGPKLLIGHSLGGAAVLAAALSLAGILGVATIGSPFDVKHVTGQLGGALQTIMSEGEADVNLGGRPFKIRKEFVEDLDRHDQRDRISSLRRALLVMHSPVDTTVAIGNAAKIFEAAHHPKSFISLDHADHLLTNPADATYAAEVIAAWASRFLAEPAQ